MPDLHLPDGNGAHGEGADAATKSTSLLSRKVEELAARVATVLAEAEEANRKAQSESGYAFNAKGVAEEHAKQISQMKGAAEADINWLATTKKNAEDAAQAILRLKGESEKDSDSAAKAKAALDQLLTLSTARAESMKELAQTAASTSERISKLAIEIEALSTKASLDATIVSGHRSAVEADAAGVKTQATELEVMLVKSRSDTQEIAANDAEAKKLIKSMEGVRATGEEAVGAVKAYNAKLAELEEKFKELHTKTESLLPGATSAGLASAFRSQKSRFDAPAKQWLWIFIGTVVALLIAGVPGIVSIIGADTPPPSWEEVARRLIGRLPLVGPLVWLGIYAGRNYMLALRMQEEYAFKEALSATFEGYKREMSAIGSDEDRKPLLTLCENVLRALAQRPGRIYEGKQEDITPLSAMKNAITPVTDAAVKAVASVKSGES